MKKLRFFKLKNLTIAMLTSFAVLFLLWLIYPLPKTLAKPETKVFEQVWQTVNENFYDPKLNGVDWKAIRQKYEPQVARTKSIQEAAVVINQMLSELRTSHTRFYTQDEPAYYQLLGIFQANNPDFQKELKKFFPKGKIEYSGIGAFTKDINGKTFISAILDASPAAKAGLKVGDQLLSVEGGPYQPIKSFAGKAGQKVTLLIQRKPDANTQEKIAVTPKIYDAATMFLEAQQASTQVIQRNGKKIGYVHIWSNAADPDQEKLRGDLIYGRLRNAEALVLDLRDGWGGGDIGYLNIFTAKEGPSITSIPRNGKRYTSISQWKKPVVMVINEGSRSSKEILAYGFKQHKIGPVIGSKTTGAVVAGRPFLMSDGSFVYLAVSNVFLNETQRLEGKGVAPDINVPFSLEYAQAADPQKERAIEAMLEALNSKAAMLKTEARREEGFND
ncbi:S41 family peptidase [Brasilonema octagenarum]|uniref:Peptidase S41 n=1 Tax=Brasilonema octagenarum UFV-OR1 TaxID=417115 RepID=A0ABX1MCB9_9CYAN|nr:S41 family peptidase [Brasilonema octagenarum]NMF64574.1 peptidase S41 [Brasilonema octagenarum UFV-OR1]